MTSQLAVVAATSGLGLQDEEPVIATATVEIVVVLCPDGTYTARMTGLASGEIVMKGSRSSEGAVKDTESMLGNNKLAWGHMSPESSGDQGAIAGPPCEHCGGPTFKRVGHYACSKCGQITYF